MTTDQTARIAETLAKLAGQITKAREFQVIRRNRDDGDIEYQIFADTDVPKDGCQIAWVQSTKADAEFIAFAFTHADLLTTLQAALEESNAERDRWLSCAEAADDALETLRREREATGAALDIVNRELDEWTGRAAAAQLDVVFYRDVSIDQKLRAEAAEAALSTLQTQLRHALHYMRCDSDCAGPWPHRPEHCACGAKAIRADIKAALLPAPEDVSEPVEMVHPIQTKLTILLRAEAAEAAISTLQTKVRELIAKWTEEIAVAEREREQSSGLGKDLTLVWIKAVTGDRDQLAVLLPAPEGETSG